MRKFKFKYIFGIMRLIIKQIVNSGRIKISGFKYFVGKNVEIDTNCSSKLILNDKVYLSNYCKIDCIKGSIKIGYNNFFNSFCKIIAMNSIEIGQNNIFGPNVSIYDHDHKYGDRENLICKQGFNTSKVIIGSNVWIGANVVITKGVSIGNRVIVGANSVVTSDLESDGMYAGNPARFIKSI